MEAHSSSLKDGEKKRNRFMGKLFKDKKEDTSQEAQSQAQNDVNDFLHGPSDTLHMVGTSPSFPPPLMRLDTSSARRWPAASDLPTSKSTRGRSASPKRSRKGLVVRFTDEKPEVIGEGGDEATSPVAEIGMRRRAHTHPPVRQPNPAQTTEQREMNPSEYRPSFAEHANSRDEFRPGLIRRTQTGAQSIPDIEEDSGQAYASNGSPHDTPSRSFGSRAENDRRSFADKVRADMRSEEGRALVQAASHSSDPDELFTGDESTESSASVNQLGALQINTRDITHTALSPGIPPSATSSRLSSSRPVSPNDTYPSHSSENHAGGSRTSKLCVPRSLQPSVPITSSHTTESPATLSRTSTSTLQDTAVSVGDDALQEFQWRIGHFFTLFRLSTEASKPLTQCSLEELVRVAMWWFLKGRMNLESAVRDRPSTPRAQQANYFMRAQAYADLAKSLWIVETVTSPYPQVQSRQGITESDQGVLESRQAVLSSLRKLTMSMKRNNFLPPDPKEAPLTQGLDPSIWIRGAGDQSLLYSQRMTSVKSLSDAMPLGDTSRSFQLGRMFVEATLVEAAASQQYRCAVLISLVRGLKENSTTAVIASQDGALNFSVQSDKSRGLTWEDVRWRTSQGIAEITLPRGFILLLHCNEQELRTLYGTHEYETRTQSVLAQRSGEEIVFETFLNSFQYFDQSQQPPFPKEAQPDCHFRLFEKTVIVKAATGPRSMHRGFRLGINTSTKSKTLRCIDQEFLPSHPVQFGFLRGEGGLPALLLKIDDGMSKYTMVCTFYDPNERFRLHTILTGTALGQGEDVIAEAPITGFSVAELDGDLTCLQALEWQGFRFINYDHTDFQTDKTVLSENLRVAIDFKGGSLTDRINVEPGELKVRLDVMSMTELKILRQPQEDMTASVAESQVSKDLPRELASILLNSIAKAETIRKYTFPSLQELHLFQAALTGFAVTFDGIACSFNISRRRMVVPIYKKWDAATTRVQIVQREKVIQLLAFFDNFNHGKAMNFTLKSTDIFETSSNKKTFSLRIVDAKFSLPKAQKGSEAGVDHEFVCLDMPEYPGEHDDVTVVFETEADRDSFAKALPAPSKIASRMPSVRR
ncbi:uncharacterized protein RAG0_06777 [Rhynchosporium agropyri]|uniref:Uncharacterized protein n=1 Tax=Rhynchosporium agropyri TaxID=914238 RepID=A0A1E1KIN5_9HELO|nr:uncharacterized protein RAG0_06777 [Rhynchosporium agropyri]